MGVFVSDNLAIKMFSGIVLGMKSTLKIHDKFIKTRDKFSRITFKILMNK